MFRFSLKWILAAMVYAAIAAAAFSQESWVYADLLCAASLLALGYAVLLVVYARGERQAAAAGFAVLMVLMAACILLAPQSVPTFRILTATGVARNPILPTPIVPMPAMGTFASSGIGTIATGNTNFTPSTATWALTPSPMLTVAVISQLDVTAKLRAANAVATMLLGLVGGLLGLLAFNRARKMAY